jgi:hypothetical protein
MSEKLSFRKRISIVKDTVVKTLIESKELSKLGSGSSKNGYYSLSTIMETFQPALVDNDLDFDIEMSDDKVTGIWVDCDSDMTKTVIFELGRLAKIIENLERLPQMQNAIQTEGSIKTYFRRYALTAFLNLPATDEIDSQSYNKKPSTPTPAPKPDKPKPKPTPAPPVPAKTADEFIGLTTEQKAEINKKDKAIVDYLLKTAKYNSLDEVKFSEYDIFMNNIKICEQKKAEKEKTTADKPKKSGEQLQEEMQDKLGQILLYVAERNDGGLTESDLLELHSSFKGRDGKTVKGVDCISKLTGKRLSVTYGNVCKAYPDVSALIKEEYENKMKEKKRA